MYNSARRVELTYNLLVLREAILAKISQLKRVAYRSKSPDVQFKCIELIERLEQRLLQLDAQVANLNGFAIVNNDTSLVYV